ncbi:MAG TPA: hypothetical protein VK982_07540 [Bacteroidales bacterium]|nr:hypothetical protein [Bacteroidales bacterium]
MNKYYYGIFFIIYICIFTACNSNKQIKNENINQAKEGLVKNSINNYFTDKDSIQTIPNDKGNYILFLSETKKSPANPVKDIHFIIYAKSTDSIIYENNFNNTEIQWHSNTQLILTRYYGITDKPGGTNIKYQLIDLHTGNIKEYKKNTNIQ